MDYKEFPNVQNVLLLKNVKEREQATIGCSIEAPINDDIILVNWVLYLTYKQLEIVDRFEYKGIYIRMKPLH